MDGKKQDLSSIIMTFLRRILMHPQRTSSTDLLGKKEIYLRYLQIDEFFIYLNYSQAHFCELGGRMDSNEIILHTRERIRENNFLFAISKIHVIGVHKRGV